MEILGFNISKAKKFGLDPSDGKVLPSFVPPTDDSGAAAVANGGGHYGSYLDFDGTAKSESELITRYRDAATYPDCDNAIEEICSEAIGAEDDETVVKIMLDDLKLSKSVKLKTEAAFEEVKQLLDFETKSHEIFKRWYVDGRLYYHKMFDDKKPQDGIQELRFIDPRKIKKVRDITKTKDSKSGVEVITKIQEYFLFTDSPLVKNTMYGGGKFSGTGLKIDPAAISYVTSGIIDLDRNMVLGHLNKAVKPVNMLKLAEDAMLIFRLSRAPSRRVFYIDTGNLPKAKAEQHLKDTMAQYRNKIVYDACLAMDTMIPLLDGRTLSLYDMQKEHEAGKELWVYSCDPVTGKFAPGLVSSAGVTKFDQKVMKITLDNGESITCTYDHKFPVWNKGKTEAKDLEIGDSMIPFYTRQEKIHGTTKSTYEQIFENESKKWKFTHREVSKWKDINDINNEMIYEIDEDGKKTVHHKNYNRYDNSPDNLVRMSRDDHFAYHTQHNSEAGKIGGKISGPINGARARDTKIGIFGLTQEQRIDASSKAGTSSFNNKSGIHAFTDEQRSENGKNASNILCEMLANDPEFNAKFRKSLSDGWSDDSKLAASERAKSRMGDGFLSMQAKGREALWNDAGSADRRNNLRKDQTTHYTKGIIDLVIDSAKFGLSKEETAVLVIATMNYAEWQDINMGKFRLNHNYVLVFTIRDVIRIAKLHGFSIWKEFVESLKFKNHKIVNIEYLDETIDVGTLGIDKEEKYHNYHTFALASGIYTCNSTGEIKDSVKHMSMLEDFWLPRNGAGAGTKIENLEGIANTNQKDEVEYYQQRVYSAMNVPMSRLTSTATMNFGAQSEITQDELKFAKFIARLRRKFSELFNDLMRTQSVLTGICSAEEWDELFKPFIKYTFAQDIYWKEAKELENFRSRIDILNSMQDLVGKYYSMAYVKKNILQQSEDEIDEMQKEMDAEKELLMQNSEFDGQLDGAKQAAMNSMMPPEEPQPK